MGEAKQKRRRHAALLDSAAGCIYCACKSAAVEVDHMPPRLMFRMTQRPKGLEFPSCTACNRQTSRLDVVAAFMTRTYPGIGETSPGVPDERDSAEWDRVMAEVFRVAPDVMKEVYIPHRHQRPLMKIYDVSDPEEKKALFRANGPVLSAHMQAFSAKVGFALHYEFKGEPVPTEGLVQVRWFTSQEIENGLVPKSLYETIGVPRFLKQGKVTSDGTFLYGGGVYQNNKEIDLYYL